MKSWLQIVALLFPAMWKTFHVSTKMLFFVMGILFTLAYFFVTSWGAIKSTGLEAYDARWHTNYQEAHGENDKLRSDIITKIDRVLELSERNTNDIEFLKRHLIEKNK